MANPPEEEIRLKVLHRWTCQTKPPGIRNQAGSASSGFGGGHARANPREIFSNSLSRIITMV